MNLKFLAPAMTLVIGISGCVKDEQVCRDELSLGLLDALALSQAEMDATEDAFDTYLIGVRTILIQGDIDLVQWLYESEMSNVCDFRVDRGRLRHR